MGRSLKLVAVNVTFLLFALAAAGAAAEARADQQARLDNPTLRMTLVDPGPVGAETTTNIYFPQVAVGGGYETYFVLMNTGATAVNGTLFLTDQDGNALNVDLRDQTATSLSEDGRIDIVGSNFPTGTIAPGGMKFFRTRAVNPATDPQKSGWARVQSSGGSLNGVATFAQFSATGTLTTAAGVLSSATVNVATIPIADSLLGATFVGYAVANPGTANITVKVVIVNSNGTIRTPSLNVAGLNPLGPGKQIARFFFQDGTPSEFTGTAVLIGQNNAQFAVVALVQIQGLLSAIPVIPEKAPAIN
jgi:hypothetical protein